MRIPVPKLTPSARDVAHRGNHDGKNQPVRQGDSDQAHGSVGFGVQYNGSRADKAESEGPIASATQDLPVWLISITPHPESFGR